MNIVGHEIDVTDIERFGRLINDRGGDFIVRCFTSRKKLGMNDTVNSTQNLAGKFAAKEAVAKALGTGFDGTVAPSDIEVLNTAKGEPTINLRGGAEKVARELRISRWCLSISHSETVAIASAIALASSFGD